jgi:phosphohistidine phosphatase SixA
MHIGRQIIRRSTFLPLIIGLLCLPSFTGAAEFVGGTEPHMKEEALLQALQQGGYVIYFRHAATTMTGEKTVEKQDLDNCALQRNLSPEGKAQSKAMGAAIKRLQIPIGHVYTSPYCRAVDTAMNLFGKAEKSDALHFAIHITRVQHEENTRQLLDMLATKPAPGMNTAIVSHTANLNAAVKIFPRPEGVAHVFKPEGNGNFSYVGMIMPETWITSQPSSLANKTKGKDQGWFSSISRWFSSLF